MTTIDVHSPEGGMRALLKARASLDGSDSVMWFRGTVHAWIPGGTHSVLFGFEGYNVGRVVAAEGGYDLLTREAVFYLDPRTDQILSRWTNPFTQREVDVVHVLNDPVNQRLRLDGPAGEFRLPVTECGDHLAFNMDIFLAYPSPLPRADFPDNSQDDVYQAVELFQFYAPRASIEDESVASSPSLVTWTRIAPWLPFMGMGDRPGQLVYHCRGTKLSGGYAELPERIRRYVEDRHPQFASAPREITGPNETSWTYFRKLASPKSAT